MQHDNAFHYWRSKRNFLIFCKEPWEYINLFLLEQNINIKWLNTTLYMWNCPILKLINKIRNKIWYSRTLNCSSNVIGDSNDESKFPQKLLVTDTQNLKIYKAFANNSLANIKSSKCFIAFSFFLCQQKKYRKIAALKFLP